jgi:hypothetical protein
MRYPVSPIMWAWPPLWPFLLVITAVWTLTFWATWVLGHLALTVVMSWAFFAVGAPWYYLALTWLPAASHIALYVWYRVAKVQSRRARERAWRDWEEENAYRTFMWQLHNARPAAR